MKALQPARQGDCAGYEKRLVSVVVPTHNRPALLARALRSACHQTYRDLEIIVVDDASRDDTAGVVQALGDSRIRYLRHETNRGGAATRNTGIRAARGEYMAFLDDDDMWEPDKTAVQLALMQRFDASLCSYHGEESPRRYRTRPTVDLRELRHGFFRGGGTSALMVRAERVRAVMFDETLPRCQDWDFCIRLGERCEIGYVPRPLVRYNDGDHVRISNRLRAVPLPVLEQDLRMLQKHKEFFGPRLYRFHMCRMLLRSFRHRPDRVRYLLEVSRKYGVIGVMQALVSRMQLKVNAPGAPALME